MVAVGDECGGADLVALADPVERDELVADEADDACGGDSAEVVDGLRRDEAADRFDGGDDRGQGDHRDDEETGEVFGSSEAVGVAPRRRAPRDAERDEQRYCGEGVAEVVDRVGDERDRSGDQDDGELEHGGDKQRDEGDLYRADAAL